MTFTLPALFSQRIRATRRHAGTCADPDSSHVRVVNVRHMLPEFVGFFFLFFVCFLSSETGEGGERMGGEAGGEPH